MNAHFVYALKGRIRFRFDGADEAVIEINMHADYMTAECEVGRPTDLVHAYCVPVATRWSSA